MSSPWQCGVGACTPVPRRESITRRELLQPLLWAPHETGNTKGFCNLHNDGQMLGLLPKGWLWTGVRYPFLQNSTSLLNLGITKQPLRNRAPH